jgi:hypothetical protein
MKKRTWFQRSSLILSAVLSMAAPAGKALSATSSKGGKHLKKSKATLSHAAHKEGKAEKERASNSPARKRSHAQPAQQTAHRLHHPGGSGKQKPAVASRSAWGEGRAKSTSHAVAARRPLLAQEPPEVVRRPLAADELPEEVRRPLPASSPEEVVRLAEIPGRYEWRRGIGTTVFWVGEKPTPKNPVPNDASSWDPKWSRHFGGYDDPNPKARKGLLPAGFTPRQNPFYVALPYNDITKKGHKDEASAVIPWFKKEYTSKWKSVCKGRWLAIRKGDRICYAQWEDAGPFTTDDADYVFGKAPPKANPNNNAGLDVSPAVRDYLGMNGSDVTDWKFVELDEIPNGPWAEHGDNNHFVMSRNLAEKEGLAMTALRESPEVRRFLQSIGESLHSGARMISYRRDAEEVLPGSQIQ